MRPTGGLLPPDDPMTGLRNVMLLLFLVLLVKNVVQYLQLVLTMVVEQRVTRDLRDEIYRNVLVQDLAFFHRTKSGQIISRLTNDADQTRNLVTKNLAKALSNLIQVLFLVTAMLLLSVRLTLIALIAIPVMVGLWNHFRDRLHKGVLRVWDAVAEVASHIQETVGGIRLVKASSAEPWEDRRFRRLTDIHYRAVVKNERSGGSSSRPPPKSSSRSRSSRSCGSAGGWSWWTARSAPRPSSPSPA